MSEEKKNKHKNASAIKAKGKQIIQDIKNSSMSVRWLKNAILVSIISTTIFWSAKALFYGLTYNDWKNMEIIRTSAWAVMIIGTLTMVFKFFRLIPRYRHFRDVENMKSIIDLRLTTRMLRLSFVLLILYSLTLSLEIRWIINTNAHMSSYIATASTIITVVTTPISWTIALVVLISSFKTRRHYATGKIASN